MKKTTVAELKENFANVTLLDVLSDEHFEGEHIERARNVCVYEVVFLDAVKELVPKTSSPIVLYGLNDEFQAAPHAYGLLQEAGYTQVSVLSGGLEAWKAAGHATGSGSESSGERTEEVEVNLEESLVRWTGRNLVNQHSGHLKVAQGSLKFEKGSLVEAELTVDFESMTCTDIPEGKMNDLLIGHLKSPDFFDTANFPHSKFRFLSTAPLSDSTPGRPNHRVKGELEIRGTTQAVEFEAMICRVGGRWVIQANLDIDRTRWGSHYGSGRFFEALGKHLVNDLVSLQVQLFSR